MVKCIMRMYNGNKFCVNCVSDEVTNFTEQRRGVSNVVVCSLMLLNILVRVRYMHQ